MMEIKGFTLVARPRRTADKRFERFRSKKSLRAAPTLRAALTIRAGNHHNITVEIAKPHLSVLGRGVDVRLFDNLGVQAVGSLHDRVKIGYLPASQCIVAAGLREPGEYGDYPLEKE